MIQILSGPSELAGDGIHKHHRFGPSAQWAHYNTGLRFRRGRSFRMRFPRNVRKFFGNVRARVFRAPGFCPFGSFRCHHNYFSNRETVLCLPFLPLRGLARAYQVNSLRNIARNLHRDAIGLGLLATIRLNSRGPRMKAMLQGQSPRIESRHRDS